MKRYTHLSAGASWIAEYGDPDKPEEWSFIKTFSPYQNVDKATHYPPILFVTSTRDDRVGPGPRPEDGGQDDRPGRPPRCASTRTSRAATARRPTTTRPRSWAPCSTSFCGGT